MKKSELIQIIRECIVEIKSEKIKESVNEMAVASPADLGKYKIEASETGDSMSIPLPDDKHLQIQVRNGKLVTTIV